MSRPATALFMSMGKESRSNDFRRQARAGAPSVYASFRKASDYQLNYIQGLLRKAGRREHTEQELQDLTVFQASRLIEFLTTDKK